MIKPRQTSALCVKLSQCSAVCRALSLPPCPHIFLDLLNCTFKQRSIYWTSLQPQCCPGGQWKDDLVRAIPSLLQTQLGLQSARAMRASFPADNKPQRHNFMLLLSAALHNLSSHYLFNSSASHWLIKENNSCDGDIDLGNKAVSNVTLHQYICCFCSQNPEQSGKVEYNWFPVSCVLMVFKGNPPWLV